LTEYEYYDIVVYVTEIELTRALERGDVPNGGFHHADHLRVAWVYLAESPTVEDALARMAATLRRFAVSVGKAEKYSDAITTFWTYQVAAIRAMMPGADCATALRAYPWLLDKDLIHAAPLCASDSSCDTPDRPLPRGSA
jgi:hypothetical protein